MTATISVTAKSEDAGNECRHPPEWQSNGESGKPGEASSRVTAKSEDADNEYRHLPERLTHKGARIGFAVAFTPQEH